MLSEASQPQSTFGGWNNPEQDIYINNWLLNHRKLINVFRKGFRFQKSFT